MNILFVAPMPPSATAALAIPRIIHAAVLGLSERHDVTVAVIAGPEEHELATVEQLRSSGIDLHAVCRHEPQTFKERWRRRDRFARGWLSGEMPWRSVWYSEPRLQQVLDRLLAERRFDVAVVEDNAAATFRFGGRLPVVLTEYEVRRPRRARFPEGPPRGWPRAILAELDWHRWPRYQRATWPAFELIQVFTARDAEAIRVIAPEVQDRVRVNPFGLELPAPLPPAPPSSTQLLFAGNFTHAPNGDAAVWLGSEIMPRLRALGTHAQLTIVGPWAPRSVKELACEDVRVVGAVPDMRPLFESAAVVLAPVRIGGGMRMKVLEALAMGRAVVTTRRGAEGISADRGSAVVVADSADEIAAAVQRLLRDPSAREALGERGRAYVSEHHSPSAYARRLERVYEEASELRSALRSL